jgi:hypothetical protein
MRDDAFFFWAGFREQFNYCSSITLATMLSKQLIGRMASAGFQFSGKTANEKDCKQ